MTAPSWNSDQEFAGLMSINQKINNFKNCAMQMPRYPITESNDTAETTKTQEPLSGTMAPNQRDTLLESPRSVRCLKQNILVVRKKRRSVFDSLATPDRFAKRSRTSDTSLDATSQISEGSEDGSSSKSITESDTDDEAQINAAPETKSQEMNIELEKAASDVAKIGTEMQDTLAELARKSSELEETKVGLAESEEREAGLREASKNEVTEATVNVLRDENDRLRTNLKRQELDHYQERQSLRQTRIELQVTEATLNDQRDENDDLRFDLNLLGHNRDQERKNLKQTRHDLEKTRKQLEESRQRETALQEANTGSNIPGSHSSAKDLMHHNEHLIQLLTRSELSNYAMANSAVLQVSKEDSDAEQERLGEEVEGHRTATRHFALRVHNSHEHLPKQGRVASGAWHQV